MRQQVLGCVYMLSWWLCGCDGSLCRGSMVVSGLPSEEEAVVEEGATEVVVGVDIQGT